jgi:hypothetical protein
LKPCGAGQSAPQYSAIMFHTEQGRKCPTLFHTSHPGLAAALRRDANWRQVSAHLCGGSKAKSRASMELSKARGRSQSTVSAAGYGGHFRAVQGFKYVGGVA